MTSPVVPSAPAGRSRRRRKGMTEQAAATAIDQACRSLRLPTVRGTVECGFRR